MARKSLIWQIYSWQVLVIIMTLGGLSWYLSDYVHKFFMQQTADKLIGLTRLYAEEIVPQSGVLDANEIDRLCKKFGKIEQTRITIISPDGVVLGDSEEDKAKMANHRDRPEFKEAMQKGVGETVRFSQTLQKNMMYVAAAVERKGTVAALVRTSVAVSSIEEVLGSIYFKIAATGVITAIFAAILNFVIARQISRPVIKMERIARQFEDGHLDMRVPMPKAAEFAGLARALNEMARQLQSRIDTITQQRNESEAILSSMAEGIIGVDSRGKIININKKAADLMGKIKEYVKGKNVDEVFGDGELERTIKDATKSEKGAEQKDIVVSPDGVRFFQIHKTDIDGKNEGAVFVLNDITEIRRLENIRKDFVANVSHELKTPITSIKGYVETLLEGSVKEAGQEKHFLEVIAKQAERLNSIIEDLLSLSRLEEDELKKNVEMRKERLSPLLSEAIELSQVKARQKGIEIKLMCSEELTINANKLLFEQAVLNLIDNAVKYSEQGGTIKVAAERTEKEILICVEDYGCGIEEKHLRRIFERFYVVDKGRSRKLGGTGLGLSIVKHIAMIHGGTVAAESSVGKGSIFTIRLPAA